MAGQSEMALVNSDDQEKPTKSKKPRPKRSTAAKKTSGNTSRKKSTSSQKAKSAESDGAPIMKLRAIDIVDGDGIAAASPNKAKDQDNEQPQIIHMPPPGTKAPDSSDTVAPKSSGAAPTDNESRSDESQVTDPELLELLEQLSVTIDSANTVLEAAAYVPTETPQSRPQVPNEQIAPQTDMAAQMQQPNGPDQNFDQLAGLHNEKDDLRPLAERFASRPNASDTGQAKRGKFGMIANAALTGAIVAAGVGWLAYTNPWILENSSETPATSTTSAPERAVVVNTEDPKDQAQLADKRAPLPKTETRAPVVETAPPTPKPTLSALTPPADDPAPIENTEKAPPAAIVAAEPMRGTAGEKIALGIKLHPDADGAEMSIMLQGVPEKAKLSIGKNLGSGNWLLTTAQLDGLTLNTQDDLQPGQYQVDVIMVRSDGKVPEAHKVAVVVGAAPSSAQSDVQAVPEKKASTPEPSTDGTARIAKPDVAVRVEQAPATAPASVAKPDAAVRVKLAPATAPAVDPDPALRPLSQKEVQNILKRGDALLREGDVAGARLLLGYAATRGNKDAMINLAKSYDPEYLAKLGVRGVQPDAAKAAHWYERAENTVSAQ